MRYIKNPKNGSNIIINDKYTINHPVGETKEYIKEIADYLLRTFGFLEEVSAPIKEEKKSVEAKNEPNKGTKKTKKS